MPRFETPGPVSVTVELGVGDIRIAASDRTDTVVDIQPSDPTKMGDVAAAERTRVEFANGRLLVKAPQGWRQWTPRGGGESIVVRIELPAGSGVSGGAGVAAPAVHQGTGQADQPLPHTRISNQKAVEQSERQLSGSVS